MVGPMVVYTGAPTQGSFTFPSGNYRPMPPFEFDGQSPRPPSMQEAADAMLWETFQFPGPTDPVMLPPQASRNSSLEGRKVSFGQPLQLIDSGEVLPYQRKGKGRARDFGSAQHTFNA
jgi:hypothetical protein